MGKKLKDVSEHFDWDMYAANYSKVMRGNTIMISKGCGVPVEEITYPIVDIMRRQLRD